MTKKQYIEYTEKRAEKSPVLLNCIKAFLVGGLITLTGEFFLQIFLYFNNNLENSQMLASISLIFLSALLTSIGLFDKIAKFGGGGALVPITGFANSVVAPAIEAKSEGYVTGVASKIFTIAGPVIVFGVFSSFVYGVIYYFTSL